MIENVAIILGAVVLLIAIRIAGVMFFGWLVAWLDVDLGIDVRCCHRRS